MNTRRRILLALHLFVGIGALAGGLAAITNPINPLGAPLSLLENSPFESYFIIGLFLAGVIGGGNIGGFLLLLTRPTIGNLTTFGLGFVLIVWIVIQCLIIKTVMFLHVLFFLIGFLQSLFALLNRKALKSKRVGAK